MKKNLFFWGPAGHYIKSIRTGDTKMSANADLITVEIYVQKGKHLKTRFSYLGQNVYFLKFLLTSYGGYNKHFPNYEQILNILMG